MSNNHHTVTEIIEKVDSYRAHWSLAGGASDDGSMMGIALTKKDELRNMVTHLIDDRNALAAHVEVMRDLAEILLCIYQCDECKKEGEFNRDWVKQRLNETPEASLERHDAEVEARSLADAGITRQIADLIDERRHQEDAHQFDAAHDDHYTQGELAAAAASYSAYAEDLQQDRPLLDGWPPAFWPFEEEWWKPSRNPRRNLVKAAALILAEIERIDRKRAGKEGAE
ncbi:hypothetical protein [Halomonas sp. M20]|uniref:hypothetical protein n=1 Tax=Halomonas sp. M20 TaxID=2763264 RepID=UPI001D0A8F95|nr:hypothetical protein [Halomonas sp. M20]